jgi:hypothetical protein
MQRTITMKEDESAEMANLPVDLRPEDRPGVPRDAEPHLLPGTHWLAPSQQPMMAPMTMRADLKCPTPVFSTAEPPKGASGAIRIMAYRIPDHRVRHWITLLFADRLDALANLPNWVANRNKFPAQSAPEPIPLKAAA